VRAYFIRVGSTVRSVTPSELALLFESGRSESFRKPRLELSLIDASGSVTKTVHAQPTFVKIERLKANVALSPMQLLARVAANAIPFSPFQERDPCEDLVPIDVQVSNSGETPAEGIRLSLHFPGGCKLVSEYDATGKLNVMAGKRSFGGLYVDDEDELVARARIDVLGNDLSLRLDRLYVRFPEREEIFHVDAKVTLHNFPPETFQLSVALVPRFEVKYVYDDDENSEGQG
jgi:hypothetical protein